MAHHDKTSVVRVEGTSARHFSEKALRRLNAPRVRNHSSTACETSLDGSANLDPYAKLVVAIIRQAMLDGRNQRLPASARRSLPFHSENLIQVEARRFLAGDGGYLEELLDLVGVSMEKFACIWAMHEEKGGTL